MNRTPVRVAVDVLALLLATGSLVLTTATTATAAGCAGGPGDVNGDGYAEVVVAEVGNHDGAGAVHVLYGSPVGLVTDARGTARDDQYLSQSSPGVPGTERAGNAFGSAVALGDFDHDRCADLAVAADDSGGTVTVLYGSPSGLTTSGAQRLLVPGLLGAGGGPTPSGTADLEVADLDDDGVDDLAISADRTEVAGWGGAVVVVYGDSRGLDRGRTRPELVSQATPGVPPVPRQRDGFGTVLTSGDFDGDGATELAAQTSSGVQVLQRGPLGFGGTPQPALISPATPGFPGVRQEWIELGWALAAGDVDADGRDDLAVGNPYFHCIECDSFSGEGQGAVLLLRGSPAGLTTAGSQVWTQASPGVDGVAGELDSFGYTLAMGRLDDGPTADLAVAAVRDDIGSTHAAGSVTLLLGGTAGLTTAGAGGTRFHQDAPGVAGRAEVGDRFGQALAVAAVQSRQRGSLVVAAPGETVQGVDLAGLVHQLGTTGSGPTAAGSRTFDAGSPGLKGSARLLEQFGSALD